MTNKEARCLTEGVRVYIINSEHQKVKLSVLSVREIVDGNRFKYLVKCKSVKNDNWQIFDAEDLFFDRY